MTLSRVPKRSCPETSTNPVASIFTYLELLHRANFKLDGNAAQKMFGIDDACDSQDGGDAA